jgi:hypothetical protein
MTGIVTLMNDGPERFDIRCARRIPIAPADRYTSAASDKRESTHPSTTNSHEVDRSGIRGVEEIHLR